MKELLRLEKLGDRKGKVADYFKLRAEEVQATKGFEDFTKKEAEKYIESLEEFDYLIYQIYIDLEFENKNIENAQNLAA